MCWEWLQQAGSWKLRQASELGIHPALLSRCSAGSTSALWDGSSASIDDGKQFSEALPLGDHQQIHMDLCSLLCTGLPRWNNPTSAVLLYISPQNHTNFILTSCYSNGSNSLHRCDTRGVCYSLHSASTRLHASTVQGVCGTEHVLSKVSLHARGSRPHGTLGPHDSASKWHLNKTLGTNIIIIIIRRRRSKVHSSLIFVLFCIA